MRKIILLAFHLLSLVLLGLGLTLNMLAINVTAKFFIDINLFNEKRSVFGTLRSLWESNNYLPFFLILLFGIIVPIVKSIIICYILIAKNSENKYYNIVGIIGKWAMADVFAISIFVAFLGAKAMKFTTASLEPGFYYFTAYVLLSAVIVNFLRFIPKSE